MLQENKPQNNVVTVDVNVNPEKAKQFINDLVRLLNSYGLDGINICNETTIQINLLDLMDYRVTPVQLTQTIQTKPDSLVQNRINNITK
jgi:chitinase|nr:MAG TPA: ENDO-BETA-N-ACETYLGLUCOSAMINIDASE F1 [Caudoviricetes sp.]